MLFYEVEKWIRGECDMKKIAIVDDSRAYIELITDVLTKESGCTEEHFEIII